MEPTNRKRLLLRLTNFLAVAMAAVVLGGCASGPQQQLLPDEGPTTKEIYEGHLMNGAAQALHRGSGFQQYQRAMQVTRDADLSRWTRTIDNEMALRFPRIPNTELHGYVFPHLSANGHPIPGYSTSFPLYETYHYALPGEVVPVEPTGSIMRDVQK